jgi:hypothetical protein
VRYFCQWPGLKAHAVLLSTVFVFRKPSCSFGRSHVSVGSIYNFETQEGLDTIYPAPSGSPRVSCQCHLGLLITCSDISACLLGSSCSSVVSGHFCPAPFRTALGRRLARSSPLAGLIQKMAAYC